MNAALVLKHQSISGTPRKPGDYLSADEYESIPEFVRDAMESQGEIKKIVDAEAARVIETLEAKVADLEKRFEVIEATLKELGS